MRISLLALHGLILLAVAARSAPAQDIGALEARLKKLENANAKLQQTVEKLTREVEILRKTAGAEAPSKKAINKKLAAAKGTTKKTAPTKNISKKTPEGKTPNKKLPSGKAPLKKSAPEKVLPKKEPAKKIDKGELIKKPKAAPDKSSASVEIPKGKRVVSVKINLSEIQRGQFRPRDRVDVFSTTTSTDPAGKEGETLSKTTRILTAAEIFALGAVPDSNSPDKDPHQFTIVSLLIDTEQAESLLLASKNGTLHLALRNKTDC